MTSTSTPSGAAVFPVFMRGKVHFSAVAHLPTHVAEVWNADLETRKHLGIMLTDPLNRFPQSLLSHKEQCHVAKFKSMRSAFCLLFLACQKVLLQMPSYTNLFAHTQTHPPPAKQDPPNTFSPSTLLVCINVLPKPAHQGEQPAIVPYPLA